MATYANHRTNRHPPGAPGARGSQGLRDLAQEFDSIDHESAVLIAQLQLEDALLVSSRSKGKGRAGASPSDQEFALQIQAEEFSDWKQVHKDASLALSLQNALETDAGILEAYRLVEESAAADRRAAELLERGTRLPQPTEAQRTVGEDREFVRRFDAKPPAPKKLNPIHTFDDIGTTDWDWSFSSGPKREEKRAAGPSYDIYRRVSCVSCDDKVRVGEALKSACEHYWCRDCLVSVVDVFLRDESLHPLRCCQKPLATADISFYLKNTNLFKRYDIKRTEYDVPAQDRVYCSTPTCSSFLGSANDHRSPNRNRSGAIVTCQACRARTCVTCRKPDHPQDTCSQNEAVEEVRALAKASGWQTCPTCAAVVELHHGCNHMTCRCRTEFCYVCGVLWKNCPCDQWDEQRLVVAAEFRAENVMGGQEAREAQPEVFGQRVEQAMENLRANHGCENHDWRGRTGGGNCEECGDYLPVFLKMCRSCSLVVCRRCSLNRL
ncbi:IBR domain-containing protein [Coprinopsis marcescibilis]|uniref:RBR-type E3 ubiquitin transferase n=1 Tax=Coprinopsis marcescibilis TaxID=230819 RepID=A0A5C3KCV3_COPMA|nr:IBR domain-containing protein [Coprinopsis marcescibilis]